MSTIERRLRAIEKRMIPQRGVRLFTGYEAEDKYYEDRLGEGPTFTAADIARLEADGWECEVISIVLVVDWNNTAPGPDVLRVVEWEHDDQLLGVVQPGYIDRLLGGTWQTDESPPPLN